MRLIDADALIEGIKAQKLLARESVAQRIMYMIDNAATYVFPERHAGRWIAEQKDAEYCEFRCSACDHSVGQTDQFDETEVKQFSEWYSYCPSCGADMRGEPK